MTGGPSRGDGPIAVKVVPLNGVAYVPSTDAVALLRLVARSFPGSVHTGDDLPPPVQELVQDVVGMCQRSLYSAADALDVMLIESASEVARAAEQTQRAGRPESAARALLMAFGVFVALSSAVLAVVAVAGAGWSTFTTYLPTVTVSSAVAAMAVALRRSSQMIQELKSALPHRPPSDP